MRTIKDPKKKPELRRRVEQVEEQEEDNKSTKSTPPKKRKTAKSSKDKGSSLNDSGSFVDSQSDIVSERSSVICEDDNISDISSVKSTPPKKRTCNRVVNKPIDVEVNGEAPLLKSGQSTPEKSPKGKKKQKVADTIHDKASPRVGIDKKSPKSKKSPKHLLDNDSEIKVSDKSSIEPKKKKAIADKKKIDTGKNDKVETAKSKTKAGRKRKLSGPQGEIANTEKDEQTAKPKAVKKGKKAKNVQDGENNLDTESIQSKKDTVNEEGTVVTDKTKTKPKPKKTSPKKPLGVVEAFNKDNPSTSKILDSNQNSSKVDTKQPEQIYDRVKHISESETEGGSSDESSELETSFDSINSHRSEEIGESKDSDKANTKSNENESVQKEEQSIKCENCGYISKSKGGHTRHLRKCQPEKFGLEVDTSSKVKLHSCEQCDYSAPKRVLVINHMRIHNIFLCKRCKFRTDNDDVLEEHCTLEHKDRSDCKFCKNCNRYVKCSDITLEQHIEECQGRIPFKCPECSKEFQYESSLKCHVVSHYPDQPKLFSCDQCDYKSNYKANLKKHVRHIHEQRGERNVKCLECDKMFFSEDNMRRHLKLHSEERPYKCKESDCDKSFKTMNGLKLHEISHQTDRPFPCEVESCEKSFKTKRLLVLHLNETHQNAPKNFKCSEEGCAIAFYKKCHLDRHMDAHKDNRTHFCTYVTCTKAFRTAEALKVHMLFHLDQKPLKCEHCDYTCRQKSSIRFHMKKKHPELVPNDLKSTKPSTASSSQSNHISRQSTLQSERDDVKTDISSITGVDQPEREEAVNSTRNNSEGEDTDVPSDFDDISRQPHQTLSLPSSSQVEHSSQTTVTESPKTSQSSKDTVDSDTADTSPDTKQTHCKLDKTVKNQTNERTEKKKGLGHSLFSDKEISPKKELTNEISPRKAKKTDMYEFQSEDESEDEMKPGLLRKGYDKDQPPLPRVDTNLLPTDPAILEPTKTKPDPHSIEKQEEDEKPKKERKKPGPKPKPKLEKVDKHEKVQIEEKVVEKLPEPKKTMKKRGRKKKGEIEKQVKETVENDSDEDEIKPEKAADKPDIRKEVKKPGRGRGRSPKGKKKLEDKEQVHEEQEEDQEDDQEEDQEEEVKALIKKKRGPKKKKKDQTEKKEEKPAKIPKKRGRKSKAEKLALEKKDIEPENGDATINYSEVESSELFGDSKDSLPDRFSGAERRSESIDREKIQIQEMNFSEIRQQSDVSKHESEEEAVSIAKDTASVLDKQEDRKKSDSESSDIGSDFDEDLKPPPAPRPPPMYDSEDGDIESGPENEDFNTSAMSNEPLRDFETSREISREISRDFESSHEIDDSVKTSEYINSVDTSTPLETVGTPASANPYKIDSVPNEHENPQSHHSHHSSHSVPHTPSHNSVPSTPVTHEFHESHSIEQQQTSGDRIMKNLAVHGQTNDENTDESSMPEVDKDYVGRFFEEIQSNQVRPESHISRMNSIEESSKQPEKITERTRSDSGVPSSLNSNQTDSNIQMQSPPSHKRIDLISPERPPETLYQPRADSAHNRSSDRIPSVPSFDTQFPHNPIDPYSTTLPSRDTILRQPGQNKPPSPPTTTPSFMRFPDSESVLQRQRMSAPYDRNLQNLHRIAEAPLSQNSSSPLLRHMPGRDEVFPGTTGVAGSMARNPFHSSWTGQDVRPPHWGHPTYLQQQSSSTSSSLFGKESYLPMFDPSARAAAERNMFSSLAAGSHSQRPELSHEPFQFDRFDLSSYLSYNTPPSLPVDYTRSAHSSSQKSLDERYRQPGSGVSDYPRSLPPTSTGSDMFGVNSSFNLEKFYSRDPMYHSHNITDNASNPFLPGMAPQHSMFGRDYPHGRFYAQNPAYPFMNMNDKNYPSATSSKLAHSSDPVSQQRDLVGRPNMGASESQLQDPYRYNSSMLYNMMNKYF